MAIQKSHANVRVYVDGQVHVRVSENLMQRETSVVLNPVGVVCGYTCIT